MLVISDNSALSALAEINLLSVLPRIFGEIMITRSVRDEGTCSEAPDALRHFLANPPMRLQILPDPVPLLDETLVLGAGEASSITLGWRHRDGCLLILDEKRGRNIAARLGLERNYSVA